MYLSDKKLLTILKHFVSDGKAALDWTNEPAQCNGFCYATNRNAMVRTPMVTNTAFPPLPEDTFRYTQITTTHSVRIEVEFLTEVVAMAKQSRYQHPLIEIGCCYFTPALVENLLWVCDQVESNDLRLIHLGDWYNPSLFEIGGIIQVFLLPWAPKEIVGEQDLYQGVIAHVDAPAIGDMAKPKRYRSIPVEVEAMQFTDAAKDQVYAWASQKYNATYPSRDENGDPILIITTSEGDMICGLGDYVVAEPFPVNDRKLYPVKAAIFQKRYWRGDD
ncbi:MAG TPA: hypothetical protein PKZ07_14450 [Sedimentisphaerales bacterium]|nr:hypothetical protein [Sedimentisphaerales bacterium]